MIFFGNIKPVIIHPIRKIIVPTPAKFGLYCLVSFGILVVIDWNLIISRISAKNEFAAQVFSPETTEILTQRLEIRGLGPVAIGIFWVALAAILLTLIWTIANIYIRVHNDIVIVEEYPKHPLGNYLSQPLLQLVTGIVLIALLILSTKFLFPFWVKLFEHAWLSYHFDFGDTSRVLAAIVGGSLNLHMLVAVFRLMLVEN